LKCGSSTEFVGEIAPRGPKKTHGGRANHARPNPQVLMKSHLFYEPCSKGQRALGNKIAVLRFEAPVLHKHFWGTTTKEAARRVRANSTLRFTGSVVKIRLLS
jgi:hypothetical protein